MPEIGGKKLAEDFRSMIEREVRSALDEGRAVIQQATGELKDAIREQTKGAARVIRKEAAAIREGFAPYTGNNPPEDGEGEEGNPTPPPLPPPGNAGEGGAQ